MSFPLLWTDLRRLSARALFVFAGIAPLGCAISDEPITTTSAASAAKSKPDGTSGPFTISGHVRDAAGNPVAGVGIAMHGNAQADRITDATGAYAFQVGAGTYTLHPAGPCKFAPQAANLNKLGENRIVDFAAGAGCVGVRIDPCDVSTNACLQSRPAGCFQCATDNGCLDASRLAGLCEDVTGDAPAACSMVIGTGASAPSKTQVCLKTLKDIFSSRCASDGQETPCLCGSTDPPACLDGSMPPAGPLYPVYACEFGPAILEISPSFTVKTFGAGMADTIIQCLAAFGCPCL